MAKPESDIPQLNGQVETRIVAALERISQAFRVLLWNEGKEFSLSPIQVQVLIFLLQHSVEKSKISYLAGEFSLTKATISDTVKTLEQKGLVERVQDRDDNRSHFVCLTERGGKIARQTASFAKELQAPIDRLPAADKENLLLSLMGIIHHLNRAGIITIQRMCFTCSHYREGYRGKKHFCRLLDRELEANELKIDCPEYETAGQGQ